MGDHRHDPTPRDAGSPTIAAAGPELDRYLERLRAKGHRVTAARRAVLATLLAAGETHLTPQALAEQVRGADPAIHQATVYRTLELLQDAGLVFHSHLGHAPPVYHLSDIEHSHVVCVGCGATFDVPSDLYDTLVERLADELGFVADPAHVSLTGRCAGCVTGAASRG